MQLKFTVYSDTEYNNGSREISLNGKLNIRSWVAERSQNLFLLTYIISKIQ